MVAILILSFIGLFLAWLGVVLISMIVQWVSIARRGEEVVVNYGGWGGTPGFHSKRKHTAHAYSYRKASK